MITPKELALLVEQVAPPECAESWDNCGLLLDCGAPAARVLFALDASPEAIAEAKARGCGILVAHHPLIFRPLKRISQDSPVLLAARAGLSVIAAHTSFDAAQGGVNDVLAELLGLTGVECAAGFARAGTVPGGKMAARSFAQLVKRALGAAQVGATDPDAEVARVLVIGGAGGGFIREATEAGCGALLTGEAKHSELIEARAAGVALFIAGHFATENPAVPQLCRAVAALCGGRAECIVSRTNPDPITIL